MKWDRSIVVVVVVVECRTSWSGKESLNFKTIENTAQEETKRQELFTWDM